jgi:hypothetical protein
VCFFIYWGGVQEPNLELPILFIIGTRTGAKKIPIYFQETKSEILHKTKEPPNVVYGCIWKDSISVPWFGKK